MNRIVLSSILLLGGISVNAQHLLEVLDAPNTNVKCIERVKDRNYGDGDHNFIYCAVQGPNGKKWLNLNLGAEYAKEGSPYFNPEAQPTDYNDWKAFGSLFQDGRKADGHELVEYYHKAHRPSSKLDFIGSGSYAWWFANRKYPIIETKQDIINSNHSFVAAEGGWMANPGNEENLWDGQMLNNPCPNGYRVMNVADIRAILVDDYTKIVGGERQGYNTASIFQNKDYPNLNIMTAPLVDLVKSNKIDNHLQITITADTDIERFTYGTSTLWLLPDRRPETMRKQFIYSYGNPPLGWTEEDIERPRDESYYWRLDRGSFSAGGFGKDYLYGAINQYNSMAIRCVEQ